MKNRYFKKIALLALVTATLSSCTKDLDLRPTNDLTSESAFTGLNGYKQVLAKVYGSYALTGNSGPGSSDLGGIDAGTSDFLRLYWNAQELTSDEAICAWNDPGLPELNFQTWTPGNVLLRGLYTRSLFQITVANEFLRESTDDKLSGRGLSQADLAEIKRFRAEARFLRAFQYWVLMDLFGNPPFITENDAVGKFLPNQIKRAALFTYIETELKAIEADMAAPRTNEYGRADQAAVWALLARMYLNAEVYLGAGNAKYTDAITYSSRVINAGYTLMPTFRNLFRADNNVNNPEVILSINYDGIKSLNNGGTTFLINSSINAAMSPATFGVPNGGWGGNRAKQTLPLLFDDRSGNTDRRAMFFDGKLNVDDVSAFTDGLASTKFSNLTSAGVAAPSSNGTFASTDFPLFRLAEMFLIYAEAVKRGGSGGTEAQAITYLNRLRTRAYNGSTAGNITSYNLDYILAEKGREFYWEAHRRTDLIRFQKYTSDAYLWPFKGGVKAGKGLESFRTIFPIPSADVIANPNLIQNTGY
ncbi:RagB/SusD family nutrient uptake outer membrane protein [Pedobacter puniceum]|jgi:hypothetical protein|uniref:RagB/SusD family nutrient uptake outer membrane protein n=1 Tax=Pedobacter puniceum TaxID=2666136 RepID=A0A7K0FSV4_9SPHI|nr:RagB/SusD family nutrient uptake outer membrane protein [Pedobacter puniceum]MRX48167.1 RagB/SusD family nutrient uptake outer membrane protein [Pedobacter puniceum]